MKCSNCDREIEDDILNCPFCGTKLKDEIPQDEQSNIEQEEVINDEKKAEDELLIENKNKEQQDHTKTTTTIKKSSNKRPSIITILIILILILAISTIIGVLCLNKKGESLYKYAIKKTTNDVLAGNYITASSSRIDSNIKFSTDIEELKTLLNTLSLTTNVQYDLDNSKYVLGLNIEKDDENYLDARAMINLNGNEAYIAEPNLYDKVLKVDVPYEIKEEISNYIDLDNLKVDKSLAKKVANKVYKAITKNLSKGYFKTETTSVSINESDVTVTDNRLTITVEELCNVIKNTINSLKMDNDFLEYFNDRNRVLYYLDSIEDYSNEMMHQGGLITMHIYTSGIVTNFRGATIVYTNKNNVEEIVEVLKADSKTYKMALKEKSNGYTDTLANAEAYVERFNQKEKLFSVTTEIENAGKIAVDVHAKQVLNKGIQEIDTQNSIKYSDLTYEEFQGIVTNLLDSKLYGIASSFLSLPGVSSNETKSIQKDTREIPNGVTLKENQSFVETDAGDVVVFEVPLTVDIEYSGTTNQRFSKQERSKAISYLDASCKKSTIKKFEDNLDTDIGYYNKANGYKNASVSNSEPIEVGSHTFYKKVFKYSYGDEPYIYTRVKTYYYTLVNDEYVYCVEINDDDGIVTSSEINKLLTIDLYLKN